MSKCYQLNNKNTCFYTSGSVLSWNEAREVCTKRNSTLPIITDEDIDNVFQQFIVRDSYSEIRNRSVWIDAHARPVNDSDKWHWINGAPLGLLNFAGRKSVNIEDLAYWSRVAKVGVLL